MEREIDMRRQKNSARILALLLAVLMVFGLFPAMAFAAETVEANETVSALGANEITVFVSFEGYNLGHGFYIEPTAITLPAGQNAAHATIALLEDAGYMFDASPIGSFFLDRVYGVNRGYIDPPAYITINLNEADAIAGGSIGAFDFSSYSGWMITVNHHLIETGACQHQLNDGDVIRWQFSVQWFGADLGVPFGWGGGSLFDHVDKTALVQALFTDGVDAAARQAALAVIIDPLATAQEVSEALAALTGSSGTDSAQVITEAHLAANRFETFYWLDSEVFYFNGDRVTFIS